MKPLSNLRLCRPAKMLSQQRPLVSFFYSLFFVLLISLNAGAQASHQPTKPQNPKDTTTKKGVTNPGTDKSLNNQNQQPAKAALTDAWQVDSVKLEGDTLTNGKIKPWRANFDKRIVIYVSGSPKPFKTNEQNAVYINNKKMPYAVNFNCPCLNKNNDTTNFTLTCTISRRDTSWNKWYGFKDDSLKVKIDVGTKEKQLSCSMESNLQVEMYKKGALYVAWVVVIIFIILSVLLAFVFKTTLIKDKSDQPDADKPYSLSRFQLLWWSVIIISSYILLYAIRDDFSLLSQSTLILLGISITGTTFASVVDYSESDKDRHQNKKSQKFFVDILSDDDGISVHRYQNLVFTFVFGVIFFYKVLATGNMPDFGVLELSLMGISTAAYVGLKATENKTAGAANADDTNTTNPAEDIVS